MVYFFRLNNRFNQERGGEVKEEDKQVFKDCLEHLKNMTEVEKLRFVCGQLANENTSLRKQLEYKQISDYAKWWDMVKDIPLI